MHFNSQYHRTAAQINSEYRLIEAAKKDSRQFKFIYNKYFEIVFRFIYQRTKNEIIAKDVTSEVFYKALENIVKYQFRGLPFSSWLLRIANNEVIKHYRKISKSRIVRLETKHLQKLTSNDISYHIDDLKPFLLKALKELKIEDLQLIEMRFFEKRAFKEMAEILNKTESAVKMRVYRILKKLKVLLQNYKND